MIGGNLSGALLNGADLSKADLLNTNLSKAELIDANLSGALLYNANLSGANLGNANMNGVSLSGADLSKANLFNANLSGANLRDANMKRANLREANLTGVNLSSADLSGADLWDADMSNSALWNSNISETIFEPKPDFLPNITAIASARGLSKLCYSVSAHSLIKLRKAFKEAGFRRQEREVTRAIKHTQMQYLWKGRWLVKKIEAAFNYVFFELTCQYGMEPGRPLIILIYLIPFFSFFYTFALKTKKHKTGLWLIFLKERVLKATKEERPFKLVTNFPPRVTPTKKLIVIKLRILRSYRMLRIALYFSLLSATSIGWREFNIGNWINRIQRREYTLRATGWARTVSGIQSLISVYLLALCVLTYFGRPFEAI